jgi:hypothetical protein
MNQTTAFTRADLPLDIDNVRLLDPMSKTIENLSSYLNWAPHKSSDLPEKFEDIIGHLLGHTYERDGHEFDFMGADFHWTDTRINTNKVSDHNATTSLSKILNSKPSDQLLWQSYLGDNFTAIELLDAASEIDTGSARMMIGSLIKKRSDAWNAWELVSQKDFGEEAASYIGDIFDTAEQTISANHDVLLKLVNNHSDEVKESLLDELASRDSLAPYSKLLGLLKNDDNEAIRNYAESLG